MQNNLNYIQEVLSTEGISTDPRLVIMGYSQGVSIAMRFLKQHDHPVKALIMHSGRIPEKLDASDGKHYQQYVKQCIHIAGKQDEYITKDTINKEEKKLKMLFDNKCTTYRPDIKHVVDKVLLKQISQKL